MRRIIVIALACFTVALPALSWTAVADGLTPCNNSDDGFLDEVEGHLDAPHSGETVVSFARSTRICWRCDRSTQLFEEFDTPFCPANVRDAPRILLHPIQKPFEASASSIAYEHGFFEKMRIVPSR
jgi:hypothetical protein